jgi:hypothetical protein
LAVRSDYQTFLERLGVPPLDQNRNWRQVPAFTQSAALTFLKAPETGLKIHDERLRESGGIDEGREEWQRESEAVNLLMDHSPFTHDPMRGADTWDAELIVVDDQSLEAPSFDDAPKGYRIWLRS